MPQIILLCIFRGNFELFLDFTDLFPALLKLYKDPLQIHCLVEGLSQIHCRCHCQHESYCFSHSRRDLQHCRLNRQMNHPYKQDGKTSPAQRRGYADVTVNVQLLVTVIPISNMKNPLHRRSGKIFQNSSSQHSQKKYKCHIFPNADGTDQNHQRP